MKAKKITKKALEEICLKIREDNMWKPLSQADQDFLINEALKYHPEWEWYEKQGIQYIRPEVNKREDKETYNTHCFVVHFHNGEHADISLKKALRGRPNETLRQSFTVPDDLDADGLTGYCDLPGIKNKINGQ